MRRREQEITDPNELASILEYGIVCRLGIHDGSVPYIVPMNYGYADGKLYFHSARKGKKIDLLKENNLVCFEVDAFLSLEKKPDPCEWGMHYKSIIGSGTISFIEDRDEKIRCLHIIMNHYARDAADEWTFREPMVNAIVIMELEIVTLTGKRSS